MKFLIQKIGGEIRYDFTLALIESVAFKNSLYGSNPIAYKFYDTVRGRSGFRFGAHHRGYVPIGNLDFTLSYLRHFYRHTPKPINIPEDLMGFAGRDVFRLTHNDLNALQGDYSVRSCDDHLGFFGVVTCGDGNVPQIPPGEYQVTRVIDFSSQWRAFVYRNELVGLCNKGGDFTDFPDANRVRAMVRSYRSAPVSYAMDIGVHKRRTFVVGAYDFFSCKVYGFSDRSILADMFYGWFTEYARNVREGSVDRFRAVL